LTLKASRPYGDNAFEGKPVAIMSASIGNLGGARAQYHLRQCFVFLDMHPVNRPEVMVANCPQKFDAGGVDEEVGVRATDLVDRVNMMY